MTVLADVDSEMRRILWGALPAYVTGGVHNMVAPVGVIGPHVVWQAWGADDQRAVNTVGRDTRVLSVVTVDVKLLAPGPAYSADTVTAFDVLDAALEASGWMRQREQHERDTSAGGAVWWIFMGEYRRVIPT